MSDPVTTPTPTPVQPPAEPPQTPAEISAAAPSTTPDFFFRNPANGIVYRVGPDQAPMLAQSGFQQVQSPAGEVGAGSFEELKALGEGILGGVAPVVGPAYEAEVFGNKAEQLRRLQENPWLHGIGTGIGILGTAGLGALGAGAKAAGVGAEAAEGLSAAARLSAPGLIERAGAGVEGALARAAPEAIGIPAGVMAGPLTAAQAAAPVQGAFARMAAAAANQATQGALYGAADVGNRLALGDDLTGEQIMREVGAGMLFGGALGAGGSALASAARDLIGGAGRTVEALGGRLSSSDRTTAQLLIKNRGVVASIDDAIPGAAKMLDSATPEAADFVLKNAKKIIQAEDNLPGLMEVLSRVDNAGQGTQILENWGRLLRTPVEREAAGAEWQAALTDLAKTMRESGIEHSSEWRPKIIHDLVGGSIQLPDGTTRFWVPRSAAENAANKVLMDIDSAAQLGRARMMDYYAPEITRLEKISGQLQDQLFAGKYPESNKFILRPDKTPEDVFNELQGVRRQLRSKLVYDRAAPVTANEIGNTATLRKSLAAGVSDTLHDRTYWSRLADVQKTYDAAKSAHIDATKQFNAAFLDKVTGQATAAKTDAWLKQVAEGRGRDYTKTLRNYFDTSKAYADVMAQNGMAEGASVRKIVEAAEARFNDILARGHVTRLVDGLASRGALPPASLASGQLAAYVAARAAGIPGAATVAGVLNRLRSPSLVAAVLRATDAVKLSFDKALNSGVARLFSGAATGAMTAPVARPFKLTPENYKAYANAISSYAGAPDVTATAIEGRLEPVMTVDPMMGFRIHKQTMNTTSYINTKLPRPAKIGLLDPDYAPSSSELRTINRHIEVAHDPLQVLALAKEGKLTEEHVQALDATSPRIANEIRLAVAEKIATDPGAVKKLPRSVQQSIGHLLGQDLTWGQSALAIGGTQRLYQSMGTPQTAGAVGERPRNVALSTDSMYATGTEAVNRSLGRA